MTDFLHMNSNSQMPHLQGIWDLTGKLYGDNVMRIAGGRVALSVKSFSNQISKEEKELHIGRQTSVYLVWPISITFQRVEYRFPWDDFPLPQVQPVQKQSN